MSNISFRIRDLGDDLLIESVTVLTTADMQRITAALGNEDRKRVIGWRLVASGSL